MKYFIDTEFIEKPNTIDLISIGIISEDGKTYYAESVCFDDRKASIWVQENVISKLRWYGNIDAKKGFCNASTSLGKTEVFGTNQLISDTIIEFIGGNTPEFWGYYADYDWVVFCWLFGAMIDLPYGWPMYCNDIKQLCNCLGDPPLPKNIKEHNALDDAKWNKKAWEFLNK